MKDWVTFLEELSMTIKRSSEILVDEKTFLGEKSHGKV